jgi:septum site-determining protein MinC
MDVGRAIYSFKEDICYMITERQTQSCFLLKTSFLPCTVLQLVHNDLRALSDQLKISISKAPLFFMGSPVVIDLEKLSSADEVDFSLIKKIITANGMVPIGIRSTCEEHIKAASHMGLPVINLSKTATVEKENNKNTEKAAPAEAAPPLSTRLINTPIRSGMQAYAKEGDLIVVAHVSPGAELMADGNIHVYGALRGRALAGVRGNTEARIFCQTLEAELVSIAGYYLTKEEMQNLAPIEGIIQIYLENEQVKIKGVQRG